MSESFQQSISLGLAQLALSGPDILFSGPVASGKTRQMLGLLRQLPPALSVAILHSSEEHALMQACRHFSSIRWLEESILDHITRQSALSTFREVSLLVLDDLPPARIATLLAQETLPQIVGTVVLPLGCQDTPLSNYTWRQRGGCWIQCDPLENLFFSLVIRHSHRPTT